jgi:hypothetical protein
MSSLAKNGRLSQTGHAHEIYSPIRSRLHGFTIAARRRKASASPSAAQRPICRGSIACPVAAVREWLAAAGITEGPVLLPGRLIAQSVALIVKAYAARLGLDPTAFRSGFLASAAARGA